MSTPKPSKASKKLITCLALAGISFFMGMSGLVSAMSNIEDYSITPLVVGATFAGALVLTGLGVTSANLAFKDTETKMKMTSVSLVIGGVLSTLGMLIVKISNTVFYVTQNYSPNTTILPAWVESVIRVSVLSVVLVAAAMFLTIYVYHRLRGQMK